LIVPVPRKIRGTIEDLTIAGGLIKIANISPIASKPAQPFKVKGYHQTKEELTSTYKPDFKPDHVVARKARPREC
jgi:hypothetical protein